VQQQWTNGSIKVAVATVAFGMGIDLPHVRYVVHWCMSKSVEAFYQESGRGGRDGLPAKSILYYSNSDASKFAFLIKKTSEKRAAKMIENASYNCDERCLHALEQMKHYCTALGCRRKFLLSHFGEKIDPRKVCKLTCDFCKNPKCVENAMEYASTAQIVKEVNRKIPLKSRKVNELEGQWGRPHGNVYDSDSNDKVEDDMFETLSDNNSLGITQPGNTTLTDCAHSSKCRSTDGFKYASEILSHYESLECKAGQKNGFVTFKSKKSRLKEKCHNMLNGIRKL